MEYKKDFDSWNKRQQYIEQQKPLFFTEKEIWWCQIGINIGSEHDGKGEYFQRPVVVIKKINDHIAWIVPISSKKKKDKYRYDIKDTLFQIVLSQIRTVDSRRFIRRVRILDEQEFLEIIRHFKTLINETPLSG